MKSLKILMAVLAGILISAVTALGAAKPGEPAPDFTLTDSNGEEHSLSDFEGKYVVLEWLNHNCPFVKKHYNSNNMQELQKKWTGKDVVWLSINSSAEDHKDYKTPEETNAQVENTARRRQPFCWMPPVKWAKATAPPARRTCS